VSTEQGSAGASEEYERQRAAYEEQLDRIASAEMVLQAVVSLLTIGGRRLGSAASGSAAATASGAATGEQAPPESGRDLEQVRDAIDAVRALLPILERRMPRELGPLREALSQLQFAYARESQAATEDTGAGGESEGPGGGAAGGGESGEGESGDGESGGGEPGGGESGGGEPGGGIGPSGQEPQRRRSPGPAESSGRLWVPGR
jgi:hypothetical protein